MLSKLAAAMNTRPSILAGLLAGLFAATIAAAQPSASSQPSAAEAKQKEKAFLDKIESFGWTREGFGKLGSRAQVAIPRGYRFTNGDGAREMMRLYDNIPNDSLLGMLTTEGFGPWIVFSFDDSGYVRDDEKDKLDADALLKSLKEGQERANERRKELGIGTLEILGWAVPPHFNDQTKNLEWATRARGDEGGISVNYQTRLLGRHGVMAVTLVCEPEEMEGLLPQYQATIGTFQYTDGESYAEYRSGDKVAKYGLTALIAGGAAVAASKMGLFAFLGAKLAKLGKGLIVIVLAIGAACKKIFTKLFCKPA